MVMRAPALVMDSERLYSERGSAQRELKPSAPAEFVCPCGRPNERNQAACSCPREVQSDENSQI